MSNNIYLSVLFLLPISLLGCSQNQNKKQASPTPFVNVKLPKKVLFPGGKQLTVKPNNSRKTQKPVTGPSNKPPKKKPPKAAAPIDDSNLGQKEKDAITDLDLLRVQMKREKQGHVVEARPPWAFQESNLKYLADLPKLTTLDATDMHLRDLTQVTGLTGLRKLAMPQADLPDKEMQKLGSLKQLESLSIDKNLKLTDKGLVFLRSLPRLKELRIRDCPFLKKEGLQYLVGLTDLRTLELSGNGRMLGGLQHVGRLTKLERLIFRGSSHMSEKEFRSLSNLKHLKELEISGRYSGKILADFRQAAGLQILKGVRLSNDDARKFLPNHPNLQELAIHYRGFSDAGIQPLLKFKKLKKLNLRQSGITNVGLVKHLSQIKSLKELNVQYTKVDSKGAREFRKIRPDVELKR